MTGKVNHRLNVRLGVFAHALLLEKERLRAVAREQQGFIIEIARDGQALVDVGLGQRILAAQSGGCAGALQRSPPHQGAWRCLGHAQRTLEPLVRLGPAIVQQPRPPQRAHEAQRRVGITGRNGPLQRQSNVVVLSLGPAQPRRLVWSAQ